jgi:hypothetical protein
MYKKESRRQAYTTGNPKNKRMPEQGGKNKDLGPACAEPDCLYHYEYCQVLRKLQQLQCIPHFLTTCTVVLFGCASSSALVVVSSLFNNHSFCHQSQFVHSFSVHFEDLKKSDPLVPCMLWSCLPPLRASLAVTVTCALKILINLRIQYRYLFLLIVVIENAFHDCQHFFLIVHNSYLS